MTDKQSLWISVAVLGVAGGVASLGTTDAAGLGLGILVVSCVVIGFPLLIHVCHEAKEFFAEEFPAAQVPACKKCGYNLTGNSS